MVDGHKRQPPVYWSRIAYKMFVHAGAAAAIYLFVVRGFSAFPLVSWVIAIFLAFATGFGVTLNLHRLLTHRAYVCRSAALRYILMASAAMAGQGPEASWVPIHGLHHQYSDEPLDPHTPLRFFPKHRDLSSGSEVYVTQLPWRSRVWRKTAGLAWAHGVWAMFPFPVEIQEKVKTLQEEFLDTTRKDLSSEQLRDIRLAVWQKQPRVYLSLLFILGFLIPGSIAGVVEGLRGGIIAGISGLLLTVLLAGFLRLVLVYHITASVNSAGHLFGETPRYACGCPYEKTLARNARNPFIVLLSLGERNHGNHHLLPRSAYFSRWLDPGKWLLVIFERLGLVSDVQKPKLRYCSTHRRMRTVVGS